MKKLIFIGFLFVGACEMADVQDQPITQAAAPQAKTYRVQYIQQVAPSNCYHVGSMPVDGNLYHTGDAAAVVQPDPETLRRICSGGSYGSGLTVWQFSGWTHHAYMVGASVVIENDNIDLYPQYQNRIQ